MFLEYVRAFIDELLRCRKPDPTAASGNHRNLPCELATTFTPGITAPDGGTTVMLLGVALGAVAVARRYLAS